MIKKTSLFSATIASLSALAPALAGPPAPPPLYVLTDLGDLPGGEDYSAGTAINDSAVAGVSIDSSNGYRAFRWIRGVMEDLGTVPGSLDVVASGMNTQGHIVGATGAVPEHPKAYLWINGEMGLLGTLPGYDSSWAYAINDSDQVVGWASTLEPGALPVRAFLWNNGTFESLSALPGNTESWAYDVSNTGQVVGHSGGTQSSGGRAVIWTNGQIRPLPVTPLPLPVYTSQAKGINDVGEIVGWIQSTALQWGKRAVLWKGGNAHDLGKLPGSTFSEARDINDAHYVVGYSRWFDPTDQSKACLWVVDRGIYDLNSLIHPHDPLVPFVKLTSASAINDSGWIAASGVDSRTAAPHAYLLKPAK